MANYNSLHRQCRTLESLFDTKLTAYSRLASTIARNQDDVEAVGSSERWRDMEAEIDELLEKVCAASASSLCASHRNASPHSAQLREINDQLSALSSDTDNPPSQSMMRAIQRHREVYLDYARELRRTKVRSQPRPLGELRILTVRRRTSRQPLIKLTCSVVSETTSSTYTINTLSFHYCI